MLEFQIKLIGMHLSSDGGYSTTTNRAFFVGDVDLVGRGLQKSKDTTKSEVLLLACSLWLAQHRHHKAI